MADRPRFTEVTPGDPVVPPGDRLWRAGDEAVSAPLCTGCSWPGRCKAYGSEGCQMKADEHLHVTSTRL